MGHAWDVLALRSYFAHGEGDGAHWSQLKVVTAKRSGSTLLTAIKSLTPVRTW